VALHGCTQTAADFAAGTRFDEMGERFGAYVLYPQQSVRENPNRCWNWFLPENQSRDRGEPATILALVEETCRTHPIDRERIFVAGLSAGGVMAGILAEQAPDVFAAVGIMAGVALHASHDVHSAFAAMHGDVIEGDVELPIARDAAEQRGYERLRATIWTGIEDRRVAPSNSSVLARQFARLLHVDSADAEVFERSDAEVVLWRDAEGNVRLEQWRIPLMGHAWSGGSFRGSHTFPSGPDASEEMFAFFLNAR